MPFDSNDEPYETEDAFAISKKTIPQGVEVYEIDGPFFFGIADRLKNVLNEIEESPKIFILRMRHVPMVDATGLHALEEFLALCKSNQTILVLSGVNQRIKMKIERIKLDQKIGQENITENIDLALVRANEILNKGV
ncbi:MAG: sodium-independent anion transporter [Sulfurospirillum sp.]|nr:sodium-independent anion transporter [Sulfurospirillum sp.]